MTGKGKLHNESVNVSVAVETVDGREKFLFGHVVLKAQQSGCESAAFAGFYLMGHVGLATAVVSHEHCGQMWALAAFGNHFFNFFGNLGLDVIGYFLSVNEHSL